MKKMIVMGLLALSTGAFAADAAAKTEKPAATKKATTRKSTKKTETKSEGGDVKKEEKKEDTTATDEGKGGSGTETSISGKKGHGGHADAGM